MRHSWTLTTTRSDWAQIIVYFATPLVAKGPLNAEASLRREAAKYDTTARRIR